MYNSNMTSFTGCINNGKNTCKINTPQKNPPFNLALRHHVLKQVGLQSHTLFCAMEHCFLNSEGHVN